MVTVTANDTDADGTVDTSTVVITRHPAAGSVTVGANGAVTYTSNGAEVATDSFAYRVNDNAGTTSNEATVTVMIAPVNDSPVAVNETYSTNADTALTVASPGVLSNASDPETNSLMAVLVTDPSHGTLTLNSNGSFTYTPAANYIGPDSFTYRASDGTATSSVATVSLTVTLVIS
ncbi:tandem-95 repeat protein [Mycobacterium sp. NPDC050041]|uniref:tandem-95 repeat protein n=1 Tax=Mycobacterium sp. NPDC050041 TaxID=3364293 RepID=UPI003C2F1A98